MFQIIEEAIQTGEVIRVIYHGGSNPGTVRELYPIKMEANGMVRARCLATGQDKTFSISKMALTFGEVSYDPNVTPAPKFETLDAIMQACQRQVTEGGWHIQMTNDDDQKAISIHTVRKNGNPLKQHLLMLYHRPMRWDTVVTPEGGFERTNYEPSSKPYGVSGKAMPGTTTFKTLDKAAERFLAVLSELPRP